MMQDVKRAVKEEWQYKKASLSQAFEPIKNAWDEITAPVARVYNDMYQRDAFYIKTTASKLGEWEKEVRCVFFLNEH